MTPDQTKPTEKNHLLSTSTQQSSLRGPYPSPPMADMPNNNNNEGNNLFSSPQQHPQHSTHQYNNNNNTLYQTSTSSSTSSSSPNYGTSNTTPNDDYDDNGMLIKESSRLFTPSHHGDDNNFNNNNNSSNGTPNAENDTTYFDSDGTKLSDPNSTFRYRDIPLGVYLIVIVEMCERLSFYGLASMLALFLKNEMGYTPENAKAIFSFFTSTAYFIPLFASVMGDSILGRYWTIAVFTIVYIMGSVSLVYTASDPTSKWTLFTALFLIALGTGSLKPNVNVFGAQALKTTHPAAISAYFSMFYFSINFGSVISTLILPIVEKKTSYTIAFTIPAVFLTLALIIFMSGKRCYVHSKPTQSLYIRMVKIFCAACKDKSYIQQQNVQYNNEEGYYQQVGMLDNQNSEPSVVRDDHLFTRSQSQQSQQSQQQQQNQSPKLDEYNTHQIMMVDQTSGSAQSTLALNRVLGSTRSRRLHVVEQDNGDVNKNNKNNNNNDINTISFETTSLTNTDIDTTQSHHWLDYAKFSYRSEHVEEIKQVLSVLPILPFMVFFWLNFDQQNSSFPLQAELMNRKLGSFEVLPSQVTAMNAVCILVFVPLFDSVIYPCLRNNCIYNFELKHLNRMVVGMFITTLAFISCSYVDWMILHSPPESVTVLWQIPQYVLVTIAEVLISISGLEYMYTQAPPSFRSTLAGFWGCTVAVGDLIAAVLFSTVKLKSWQFSLLCAGLMFVDMILFFIFKCWFHRRKKVILDDTNPHDDDQNEQSLDHFSNNNNNNNNDEENLFTPNNNNNLDTLSLVAPDAAPNTDNNNKNQEQQSQKDKNLNKNKKNSPFEPYDPSSPFEPHTPEYRDALVSSVMKPRTRAL